MGDEVNTRVSEPMDLHEFSDLMELVFAYSAAAHDFGFTHKMNNRFTALSMNASFLQKALQNQDYEKAAIKADQVSESIANLVKFSQNLMSVDNIPLDNQQLEFPGVITNTIDKLIGLPPFKAMKLNQNLLSEPFRTSANPGIIWIFLYAYLKNATGYEIQGPIQISSSLDVENNQYILKMDVTHILNAPKQTSEGDSLSFPSAGEMPLRYLARVIRSVSDKFELIHQADRPLTIELRINLS